VQAARQTFSTSNVQDAGASLRILFLTRAWPVTRVFTGHEDTMPSCYERLCRPSVLRKAWKKLNKANKHSHGFDNETIQGFKDRLDENIEQISVMLKDNKYAFVPLRAKPIPKEGGGIRILRIPAIRDRVVLTALKMLIGHRFRKFDRPCSHGYVPSRSRFTAVTAIREVFRQGSTRQAKGKVCCRNSDCQHNPYSGARHRNGGRKPPGFQSRGDGILDG
jgi:hypothetical protein